MDILSKPRYVCFYHSIYTSADLTPFFRMRPLTCVWMIEEIYQLVLRQMPAATLLPLLAVSKGIRRLVQPVIADRHNIERLLLRFFPSPSEFRFVQRTHGALLTGASITDFILDDVVDTRCLPGSFHLDVYIPYSARSEFVQFVIECGYLPCQCRCTRKRPLRRTACVCYPWTHAGFVSPQELIIGLKNWNEGWTNRTWRNGYAVWLVNSAGTLTSLRILIAPPHVTALNMLTSLTTDSECWH